MATVRVGYDIVATGSGECLSRHRTRQAAVDNWRANWAGQPVQIWRRYSGKPDALVVEGIWHQVQT